MFVRCFNDVSTVTRKVAWTVLEKNHVWTVFQLCLSGEKKRCCVRWIKVFPKYFNTEWEKKVFQRCLNGEKENYFEKRGVSTVVLQWRKKGVSAVFEDLQKKLFPRWKRLFFHGVFMVKKNGVSTAFSWWCFHRLNKKCLTTIKRLNGTSYYGVYTVCQR